MNTVPARSQSPFGESISAQTFTASDPLHQQFVEAVEVYRPFEVPGELGPLCEQITLPEAVELVEAIMKRDSHEVRCQTPATVCPDLDCLNRQIIKAHHPSVQRSGPSQLPDMSMAL
jgi:hypothetical protein